MDFDVMMRAILERQEFLCRNVPLCPSCEADQVQLLRKWVPAEWRCRMCKTSFRHEPDLSTLKSS